MVSESFQLRDRIKITILFAVAFLLGMVAASSVSHVVETWRRPPILQTPIDVADEREPLVGDES